MNMAEHPEGFHVIDLPCFRVSFVDSFHGFDLGKAQISHHYGSVPFSSTNKSYRYDHTVRINE